MQRLPIRKRLFDIVVVLLSAPAWLPMLALGTLAVLVFDGRPAFYVSDRRVYKKETARVVKLRTMVIDAGARATRETVPITGQRFLNIPLGSPLYTSIGLRLERFHLTELPQFVQVLTGTLSLIGNRPLPENVVDALRSAHPGVEDRFRSRAGLTGPVQLIGRENLGDAQRLEIEYAYSETVLNRYSLLLDLRIFLATIRVALHLRPGWDAGEVWDLLDRHGGSPRPG